MCRCAERRRLLAEALREALQGRVAKAGATIRKVGGTIVADLRPSDQKR